MLTAVHSVLDAVMSLKAASIWRNKILHTRRVEGESIRLWWWYVASLSLNSDCRPPLPLICPSYTHVSWFVVTTFSCVRGSQPSLTAKAHFSAFVTSRLDSCSALEKPSSKEKVPSKEKHFQINLNFHSKSYTHFGLDGSTGTKHRSASVIVYEVTQGRYTNTHSFCVHQDMKNHQSQQDLPVLP